MKNALLTILVIFWRVIILLPLRVQNLISILLGYFILYMPIRRNKISKINIDLCFKDLDENERYLIYKKNIISSAKVIFDTGVAWFWSNRRINKNIPYKINGLSKLLENQNSRNGVILFFKHSLHLELDSRILAMHADIYGIERVQHELTQKNLIFLAASTHEGEDEIVIDSYKQLIKKFPSLKLILVPRHPERADLILKIFKNKDTSAKVCSEIPKTLDESDAIIISSIGKLNTLYDMADIAFIGGSLLSKYGGHNIIEPAKNKCAIIIGPHIKNFEEYTDEQIPVDKQNEISNLKGKVNEEKTEEAKPVNFAKEQMKSTDQIKKQDKK